MDNDLASSVDRRDTIPAPAPAPTRAPEDELVLVDLMDREVGHAGKLRCHRDSLLHRAFSVFLVRVDKNRELADRVADPQSAGLAGVEVLLQRRAGGKYHSGGLWTNSCCSHPRVGEGLGEAVERRLTQELGVCGVSCEEVGSFVYRHAFDNGLAEYEFDHVFVGRYDGPVDVDPEEASEVAWVPFSDVLDDLRERPDRYTAWFVTAAPMAAAWIASASAN